MLYCWKSKNSKFAQIWAYLDHGMSFQDATDISQLQPGPVAKAKQIQQKAPLSQGWLTYRIRTFAPGPIRVFSKMLNKKPEW